MAIIAVLVAISIPIFSSQLEKAREAVDAANLRAAYAEVSAAALTGDTTVLTSGVKVDQKQTKAGWQTTMDWPENFDVKAKLPVDGASADYWTVTWDSTNSKVVVNK